MTTMTYTEWLAEGQKNATGIIDFLDNTGRQRYVLLQPDQFPEVRIYLSILGWPASLRHMPLVGERVMFDLARQEIRPNQKAVAANVRFQNEALNRRTRS